MALAVHLVLTFGHVHAEEFSPASTAVAAVSAADVQAAYPPSDDGGAAEQRYRTLKAHHFCAICAAISLLGTSVPPVAQKLALPRVTIDIHKPDFPAAAPPHELRSSSKARAPPSA
jgi:hypothetical protein